MARVSHRCAGVSAAAEEGLGFGVMAPLDASFYIDEGLVVRSPRLDGLEFPSIPDYRSVAHI